jgi:starch synthase
MRVLFVASEAYPLAKTGGLGDVARALPSALIRRGVDARLMLPGYPEALDRLAGARVEVVLDGILDVPDGRLISGRLPDAEVPVWLLDAPSLYRRPGGPYVDQHGADWPDNARRFAYLSHVAALIGRGIGAYWRADVVHANDWHTGLAPLLLAASGIRRPATVFTVHNLAFQGNFPMDAARGLGVPDHCLGTDGCEFYGHASFLKAGLRYADRVTTVSPTYAKEVLTPAFGHGLDGLLRARARVFRGIINGVEAALWTPATDASLPASFGPRDISGKRVCKAQLQRELGLPVDPDAPLFGFVSRLTHQKMADILLEALPWFGEKGAQFALVGQGDPALEAAYRSAGSGDPERLAVHVGYEETLAHRLYAGADVVLAPARYEPCGLSQLYAMRYGSLPVVRRTGGLVDTVVDASPRAIAEGAATGFSFQEPTVADLTGAMDRALELHAQPLAWRRLQMQAMQQDFSWDRSADKYLDLYCRVTGMDPPRPVAPLEAAEETASVAV